MKRISVLVILVSLCFATTQAQETFKQTLNGIKQIRIETDTKLHLIGTSGNELIISKHEDDKEKTSKSKYRIERDKEKAEKRKGLTAIYAGGEDNTGFGMYMERDGEVLRLKDLKNFTQRTGLKFSIPKHINVSVDCGNLGAANFKGFSSEIEVSSNTGDIKMTDVNGPITVHSNTGDVIVVFGQVNQGTPISLNSSTGEVDVSIPANTKADLELNTTMGTVYTDFKVELPSKRGLKPMSSRKIETKINDGGVQITLRSATGDIYLRKN